MSMSQSQPGLVLTSSRGLLSWLHDHHVSIAFTTYQAGKLFVVGLQDDGRLSTFERTFSRCMGLHASPDTRTLYMTSLYQLWRFENFVEPGGVGPNGYDAVYVPTLGRTTGDVDIHDLHTDANGRPE